MIFNGNPGFIFHVGDFTCSFNGQFNLILSSKHTVIMNNTAHELKHVVPIEYCRFINTLSSKYSIKTRVNDIFEFKKSEDGIILQKYVSTLRQVDYKPIPEFRSKLYKKK